jgi:glutamate dehydrogenase
VLREPQAGGVSASFAELPRELRALAREPRLLMLTKANARSTVHRPVISTTSREALRRSGKVAGERRFVGLYTRRRTTPTAPGAAAAPQGRRGGGARRLPHSATCTRNLLSVLQGYPRDELFQIDEDTLFETALGILRLGDRRKTRVFIRRDLYGRFYSCLVSHPARDFNTDVRLKIMEILKRHLRGTSVEFTVHLSEAVLARLHMLVRSDPRESPSTTSTPSRRTSRRLRAAGRTTSSWRSPTRLGEEAATMRCVPSAPRSRRVTATRCRRARRCATSAFIQKLTPPSRTR